MQVVLDAMKTAAVVVDADGRLVHANPSARRELSDLLAQRSVNFDVLQATLHGANTDVMVVRLRRGGAPEVFHAGPADAPSTLAARERQAILERLKDTGWKLAETARQLGISRTTLWRRLRAYGLSRDDRTM